MRHIENFQISEKDVEVWRKTSNDHSCLRVLDFGSDLLSNEAIKWHAPEKMKMY